MAQVVECLTSKCKILSLTSNTAKNKQMKNPTKMAQVVEFLPSKCEALNSNPTTAKNKNKKQNKKTLPLSRIQPTVKRYF
jgi:hypothetical protein